MRDLLPGGCVRVAGGALGFTGSAPCVALLNTSGLEWDGARYVCGLTIHAGRYLGHGEGPPRKTIQ